MQVGHVPGIPRTRALFPESPDAARRGDARARAHRQARCVAAGDRGGDRERPRDRVEGDPHRQLELLRAHPPLRLHPAGACVPGDADGQGPRAGVQPRALHRRWWRRRGELRLPELLAPLHLLGGRGARDRAAAPALRPRRGIHGVAGAGPRHGGAVARVRRPLPAGHRPHQGRPPSPVRHRAALVRDRPRHGRRRDGGALALSRRDRGRGAEPPPLVRGRSARGDARAHGRARGHGRRGAHAALG